VIDVTGPDAADARSYFLAIWNAGWTTGPVSRR
jgi:hypothetical protein